MLYEDTSVDIDSDKRFHIELHFSPGAFADFDAPAYLTKTNVSNEELSNGNSTPNSLSPNSNDNKDKNSQGSSPTSSVKNKIINHYLNKKSPFSNLTKRYQNKKLQTLPEPNDSVVAEISITTSEDTSTNDFCTSPKDNSLKDETKPRSFEDEQHQNRLHLLKGKARLKEPYNHYNTYHSGSLSNTT